MMRRFICRILAILHTSLILAILHTSLILAILHTSLILAILHTSVILAIFTHIRSIGDFTHILRIRVIKPHEYPRAYDTNTWNQVVKKVVLYSWDVLQFLKYGPKSMTWLVRRETSILERSTVSFPISAVATAVLIKRHWCIDAYRGEQSPSLQNIAGITVMVIVLLCFIVIRWLWVTPISSVVDGNISHDCAGAIKEDMDSMGKQITWIH